MQPSLNLLKRYAYKIILLYSYNIFKICFLCGLFKLAFETEVNI